VLRWPHGPGTRSPPQECRRFWTWPNSRRGMGRTQHIADAQCGSFDGHAPCISIRPAINRSRDRHLQAWQACCGATTNRQGGAEILVARAGPQHSWIRGWSAQATYPRSAARLVSATEACCSVAPGCPGFRFLVDTAAPQPGTRRAKGRFAWHRFAHPRRGSSSIASADLGRAFSVSSRPARSTATASSPRSKRDRPPAPWPTAAQAISCCNDHTEDVRQTDRLQLVDLNRSRCLLVGVTGMILTGRSRPMCRQRG